MSKKSKMKSKYKKMMARMAEIIKYTNEPHIKSHQVENQEYDEEIENEIIKYLDLLIEYKGISPQLIIHISDNHINLQGRKVNTNPNAVANMPYEEYFELTLNTEHKLVQLGGEIINNDSIIIMKYNKLDPYIDKIKLLKKDVAKKNFVNYFDKIYDISDLTREKSLHDLNLDN
jgi:2C-methyl-D-erythritol 2,4-cyclodiphosphate synthase